jgi:hypothetical protein
VAALGMTYFLVAEGRDAWLHPSIDSSCQMALGVNNSDSISPQV